MNTLLKKKNFLNKTWLKLTNKRGYKAYKQDLRDLKQIQSLSSVDVINPEIILRRSENSDIVRVVHSGNAGDIVYALPSLKKIHQLTSKPIKFYFKLDQPLTIAKHYTHPLGNVMLNTKMAEMLTPLLESQSYIDSCEIFDNQPFDFDLDEFRKSGLMLDRGDIARWVSYFLGVTPELHKPWISVEPDTSFSNTIVIARSERYRNKFIDYSIFNSYKEIVFVGVESEYADIKRYIPKIKHIEVNNFLRLAQVISGCKLFIGNQSFPFSIAEGLKAPRILELFVTSPNVMPTGDNGYDCLYQEHFEWLVKQLSV